MYYDSSHVDWTDDTAAADAKSAFQREMISPSANQIRPVADLKMSDYGICFNEAEKFMRNAREVMGADLFRV